MRLIIFCLLILGFGTATNLNAQQEEKTKKVRIMKKTIDENGNETIEEIGAEGEEAERLIKEMQVQKVKIEKEKRIELEIKDSSDAADKEQIRIELDGADWESFKESEEFKKLPAEVQERLMNIDIEMEDIDDTETTSKKVQRVKVRKLDMDEDSTIEWEGENMEEMPENIRNMIEASGVDLEVLDMEEEDGTNVFVMKDSPAKRAALGVRLASDSDAIRIDEVLENSAAVAAGLQKGDILRKINGLEIKSLGAFIKKMAKYEVGEHINLEFEREGELKSQTVILQEAATQQTSVWLDKDGEKVEIDEENVIIIKKTDNN